MMRKFSLTLLPLAMLGISSVAHAEGYIGLGLGEASVDIEGGVYSSIDDSDTSVKLFAGKTFSPNLAFESGFIDFGETSLRDPSVDADFDANALYVAAIGTIPMDQFHVYGKAGVAHWQLDYAVHYTTGTSYARSERGTDFLYGIGVGFDVTPLITLRGEVERYANVGDKNVTGDSDIDVIGITAAMRF